MQVRQLPRERKEEGEEATQVALEGRREGTACMLHGRAPGQDRLTGSWQPSLGGGSHIKGRACPYRSREMPTPCGLLAARRNEEGTESAEKLRERNPSQPPGGVKRQEDQVLRYARAPSCQGSAGNGEEAPTSQGCRRMNPRLCCIQVKKLNGGVILNPKRGN